MKADDQVKDDKLLLLENQLCFPLYAASRLMTRAYQPLLEPLGLTYPQYIVLMILWQDSPCSVKQIGERALLNTNTLTPLLKRLETLGYVKRARSRKDERVVEISLTRKGASLKEHCHCIPLSLLETMDFPMKKLEQLKELLQELMEKLD
jgi:DNA-binding MarR family transcriptional regulator